MDNSKTSVLALFPYSELSNFIIWKKQSLFERQGANKKLYPSPNPNLKLNPNCNPSSNPNVNPNPNLK